MPRKILVGVVVANKNDKTVKVRVERSFMHPLYKKRIKKHKNYMAHDENNQFHVDDVVEILESPPISKMKKWVVLGKKEVK